MNKDTFYLATIATFTRVNRRPDREPDYISKKDYFIEPNDVFEEGEWVEKISSRYWYTEDGVFRESDHWGDVATCHWPLEGKRKRANVHVGFCRWKDFNREPRQTTAPKVNIEAGSYAEKQAGILLERICRNKMLIEDTYERGKICNELGRFRKYKRCFDVKLVQKYRHLAVAGE